MPSTTVHLPDALLSKIDQIVNEIGISRNRFIIKACEEALKNSAGRWPEGFFEPDLSTANLRLLTLSIHPKTTLDFKNPSIAVDQL